MARQILITFADEHPDSLRDDVERMVLEAVANRGWGYGRSIDVETHEQVVYGPESDPDALHCDLCTKVETAADLTPDWNGETGNHLSCEAAEPDVTGGWDGSAYIDA